MKFRITFCLLLITALFNSPVYGGLVYSNGTIASGNNSGAQFSASRTNTLLADDFSLAAAATISRVDFWGGHWSIGQVPADDNFQVFVFNDSAGAPGSLLGQSDLTLISRIDTGFNHNGNANADIWHYSMSLDSAILIPDTNNYWFSVQSTTTQSSTTFFWQETWPATGTKFRSANNGASWLSNSQNVAFDLFETTAVPEPTSFVTFGLAGMLLARRRRR